MNESQRAMVAAKLANLKRGDNRFTVDALIKASTQTEAAGMLNVSRASVQKAKQVQENATPELAAQVSSGDVAVSQTKAVSFDAHGFCFLLSKPSFLCGLPLPR